MFVELKAHINASLNNLTIDFLSIIPMVKYTREGSSSFIIDVDESYKLSTDFEQAICNIAANSKGQFSKHDLKNCQFIHITQR